MGNVQFEAAADELYGLDPSKFTQARDAFVAAARKDGDRETADALKLLRRPSVGAWLANRIVRERPYDVDRLLGLGAELRDAQSRLDGEAMRRLGRDGRDTVEALVRDAAITAGDRREVSEAVLEDLEATLDVALGDPTAAETLRAGRWTSGLRYSGLGLAGDMTAASRGSPAGGDSRPIRPARDLEMKKARDDLDRVRAQLKDAETAVAAAEVTLNERREVAERAARRVRDAEKAIRSAEKRTASRAGRKN